MRLVGSVVLCTVLIASLCLAGQTSQLDKEKDRISYSLGHQIGEDIKRQAAEVDPEALRKGVEDGLAGKEPILPRKEMNGILEDLKGRILAAHRKDNLKLADTYREKGSAFLAENAKREGVVMLRSGLQYKVLREGAGRSPGPTDRVTVRSRGTTVEGAEFHNSFRRENPETFALDQVIPGLKEGLQAGRLCVAAVAPRSPVPRQSAS